MTLCDIANYVLQGICGQQDMQFSFEGLQDEEDKQARSPPSASGQVQNGIVVHRRGAGPAGHAPVGAAGDVRAGRVHRAGADPVQHGPAAHREHAGRRRRRAGDELRAAHPFVAVADEPAERPPRGPDQAERQSHPAPVAPHREAVTPAHSAAAGAIQSPTPRTGGTTSRSSVAGSRKKAVESELGALARHLRKGRLISTWDAGHIPERALGMIAEDIAKGVLIDVAVERAGSVCLADATDGTERDRRRRPAGCSARLVSRRRRAESVVKAAHWPGWERDLGLVGAYKNLIGQAFHDAEARGSELRKKAATGGMFVSNGTLRDLISDEVRDVFGEVLTPLWTEAWHLGYASAKSLVTGPARRLHRQGRRGAPAGVHRHRG